MQQFIFISLFVLGFQQWSHAQTPQYQVAFDTGQTAISLAQLDSIKALVRRSRSTGLSKIRVLAYAHDAKKGDTNEQLSRRRAYLIQQCLEREGVPLSLLYIQNIVCDAALEVCTACANLSLEKSDGSLPRNSYSQRNRDFLYRQSTAKSERFWIDPSQENYVISKAGILIHLPAHTLLTTYDGPVELTLRVLENSQDHWQHGLASHTEEGALLAHKSIYLQARQDGALLPANLRYPTTLVLPNHDRQPQQWKLWQQQDRQWKTPSQHSATALFLGDYYNKQSDVCATTNQQNIYAPNYGAAPERPNYINIQQATTLQDAAIAALEERLAPLEAVRYNKSGKKEIWTPQQKQRAFQLRNQKAQFLVTREKIRREAQQKNTALEEAYYKQLGAYNRRRHTLQTAYVKALEQRARHTRYQDSDPQATMNEDRCLALQQYQQLLQAEYDSTTYKNIEQQLAQIPASEQPRELGYWIKSEQLGWLALGRTVERTANSRAQFFAQSSASPYKITAFYHQKDGQVFNGKPQEDGRLAFTGIDPEQAGHVLAVLEKEGEFWLALQAVGGTGVALANKTIGLQFEHRKLQEALQSLPASDL
jgi:hypothetical protein